MAFNKIKLDKNDILFSKMIRERDDGKCIWCPKNARQGWNMTNSHYWGRADKGNRFNPLNCDTLCFTCHMDNESNKQGKYRTFKIKQLGKKIYDEMERAHYRGYKKYGKFEADLLNKILKEQYASKAHMKKGWQVFW